MFRILKSRRTSQSLEQRSLYHEGLLIETALTLMTYEIDTVLHN